MLEVNVDMDDLAAQIAKLPIDTIMSLIISIDEYAADWDLTREILKYATEEMKTFDGE